MNENGLPLFEQLTKQAPKKFSVTELTQKIKGLIEPQLTDVWVQGEVSNYRPSTSGHAYFSLKDKESAIGVAIFSANRRLKFELKDGMEIVCRGRVSIYLQRGNYQLVAEHVEPLGQGALQLAFEQLKARLQSEGLFDQAKKRKLPAFPKRIAIVTSPHTAALKDVLNVLRRRTPHLHLTIVPAIVQGEQAPSEIIRALETANRLKLAEVILLVRGGGSIEDLWCFNHEALARAIRNSEIPVVTGVGHEIDFTIADFVSDLRAPTPSAAAEIVTGHWVDSHRILSQMTERAKIALMREVQGKFRVFQPLSERLGLGMNRYLVQQRKHFELWATKLVSPKDRLREQIQRLDDVALRLENTMTQRLERLKSRVSEFSGKLDALSPLKVLGRGYSLVSSGEVLIKSAKQIKVGQKLEVRFHDGIKDVQAL